MEKMYKYSSLAKGGESIIKLTEDSLTITRPGLISKVALGFTGEKTIMFNKISAVQIKKVGLMRGYIQFVVSGAKEAKSGSMGGSIDENIVYCDCTFNNKKINDSFEEIKRHIENYNSNGKTISKYDDLKKLKDLLDSGVITNEEFEKEKAKILQ